jgi:ferritin-like metal-binding protein YciE
MMTLTENSLDRLRRYIDDAIALEASSLSGLRDMAGEATDPRDTALFEEHIQQTERQKERLEARLTALGGSSNKLKDVMNTIGVAATNLLHLGKDTHDKATRNLIQAYSMESLEIATYEALQAAANAIGDTETASLAWDIQAEEEAAARKVFARIAENSRIAATQPT